MLTPNDLKWCVGIGSLLIVTYLLCGCDSPTAPGDDIPYNPVMHTVILYDQFNQVAEYGWTKDKYGMVQSIILRSQRDTIQVEHDVRYTTTWKKYQEMYSQVMAWKALSDTTIIIRANGGIIMSDL